MCWVNYIQLIWSLYHADIKMFIQEISWDRVTVIALQ